MIIHVVKEGETINSIADNYGVPVDRLILENELKQPYRLAVGETIVVLYPDIIYTVQAGDTLGNIAAKYNVSVFQLLRNNPYLSDRQYIYPGETIVISYEDSIIREISTNGYAFPFIELPVLRKTLPFLTYLTVFGYQVTAGGDIIDIEDKELVQTAKIYGVAPIMALLPATKNQVEAISIIHTILADQDVQNNFFSNLISKLKEKGYYGVSIDTPFIDPGDRKLYDNFVLRFSSIISKEGFKVFVTFSIRVFELLTGTLFAGINYQALGKNVDGITLITYEFGFAEGVPPGTVSIETFRRFLSYMVQLLPPEKISIGIRNIGYVWKLPYQAETSKGMAITYDAAIDIAVNTNSVIQFDETTYSAYFEYISSDEYVVRFWDARSIDGLIKMVPEFDLDGAGIWNIMTFFPQMWLVINSQYTIEKVMLK